MHEQPVEDEARTHERDGQDGDASLRKLGPEHRWAGDVADAVPAARHAHPFGGDLLDDESEGNRQHGEVGAAHAQRRDGEHGSSEACNDAGERQRDPETPGEPGVEDGNDISADGIECDMAEGDLASQADEHVEADADEGRDGHHRHDGELVAGRRYEQEENDRCGSRRCRRGKKTPAGHTFCTPALPKMPDGQMASARMTSENVRIWV